eukprot:7804974-Alexandrium_andersonii.AAC.1
MCYPSARVLRTNCARFDGNCRQAGPQGLHLPRAAFDRAFVVPDCRCPRGSHNGSLSLPPRACLNLRCGTAELPAVPP